MTDIVERLRTIDISWSDEGELAAEAAVQIVGMRQEIASIKAQLDESKANDLFAMKLLAESQAREKVLRDALFELANLHVVVHSQSPEGRAYMKKLGDLMASTDDTALNKLLAAERERCINCYSPDFTATDWIDAIRALGDEL